MQLHLNKSDRYSFNGDRSFPIQSVKHSDFNHSGARQPCPVCGRTKDRDCSWTKDEYRVLCHTYVKESAPATINGYQFTGRYCDSGLHGADSAAIYIKQLERIEKPLKSAQNREFMYHDVNGCEVVKVRRVDDGKGKRQFWQESKRGNHWEKGLPESVYTRIHLYRIFDPLNQRAIADNQPILIVEGEGKVDLLMSMGIAATCSLGGAGKWRKYGYENYVQNLNGASIVICPDRDEPGMKHAEDIAQDFPEAQWLYAYPDSPLWNKLPTAGGVDIADWIQDYSLSAQDILAAIEPRRNEQPTTSAANTPEEIPRLLKDYRLIESHLAKRLRFNTLFKQVELEGQEFNPASAKLEIIVTHQLSIKSSREDIADSVMKLAKQQSYSPVVEYLSQVYQQYGDTTSILDDLAFRYFGTALPLHQVLVKKFLVAAVARAFQPGCKLDCALILQGKQGYGKSTFFRILASEDWFDDSLGAVSDKDERLKLHRAWIIEWAELETVFGRKDINQVKAFMSCAIDQVRPPYGRSIEAMKRASVIVGTTNQQEFLADMTGNRRFWVVPVNQPIDRGTLQQERDRIWAAAVTLYQSGEQWWLNDEQEALMAQEREQYQVSDTWMEKIAEFVEVRDQVAISEILENLFKLEEAKHDKASQNRVKTILYALDWRPLNNARMHLGKRRKVWRKN